jgi:hypothetical protein
MKVFTILSVLAMSLSAQAIEIKCEVYNNRGIEIGDVLVFLNDFEVSHSKYPQKCMRGGMNAITDTIEDVSAQVRLKLNEITHLFRIEEFHAYSRCSVINHNQLTPITGIMEDSSQFGSIEMDVQAMWKGDALIGTEGFVSSAIRLNTLGKKLNFIVKNCR